MLDRQTLEKLEKSLPRGAKSRVAKKLQLNTTDIPFALNGKLGGERCLVILEALIEEARNYKGKTANRAQEIKDEISKL